MCHSLLFKEQKETLFVLTMEERKGTLFVLTMEEQKGTITRLNQKGHLCESITAYLEFLELL